MHKKAATFSFALILSTTSLACGGDKADPGKSGGPSPEPGKGAVDQKPPAPPTPPPQGHQVFQLYDNRALAHLQRGGGLVVLPGTPGISKYTRFGRPRSPFGEPGKVDDKAVGFAATQSTIDVPLSDDQAKGVAQVRMRLKSPGAGKVTLFVNQKSTPTAALTPGWQTVTFAVPAGAVRGGENNLRFAYVFGRASAPASPRRSARASRAPPPCNGSRWAARRSATTRPPASTIPPTRASSCRRAAPSPTT